MASAAAATRDRGIHGVAAAVAPTVAAEIWRKRRRESDLIGETDG
jgi:hypothetical protein